MGRSKRIKARDIARAAGVSESAISQSRYIKRLADGSVDAGVTERNLKEIEASHLRKTIALANLAELRYQKRAAGLISREVAERTWALIRKIIFDRFPRVPAEAAENLAAERDARVIQVRLDGMFRTALQDCVEAISNLDTAGIEEV